MVSGRRSDECEACGAPYGRWIGSLGMALCGTCERAESEQPVREPVLVGDVLAGLTAAVTFAAGSGTAVPDGVGVALAARSGRSVPDARNPSTGTRDGRGGGAGARTDGRRAPARGRPV
ncbi:hypothetical protein [Streptomyces sp. NPDC056361]|uniref:hypothetical protein n=1 Tax=Streptomyces sp. NPDC056361 TaxID=3345795 RepID=UPI0035DBEA7C